MSQDTHDLVAAYALDSLDDEERERFQRHLAECEDCTEQLALLEEAATALAYAAEGPEPSPSLRGRILAAAAAEAEPPASVIRFPRRNWTFTAAGVAAVAAVAALALGLWSISLSNSLDRERSANDAYEQTAQLLGANASATPLVGCGRLAAGRRRRPRRARGLRPRPGSQRDDVRGLGDLGHDAGAGRALPGRRSLSAGHTHPQRAEWRNRRGHNRTRGGCDLADPADRLPGGAGLR